MSVVLHTFNMGTISRFNLLNRRDQSTKFDKRLDIEFSNDYDRYFESTIFSHEIHRGLILSQWEQYDYLELCVESMSVPTAKRSQLNVSFRLEHTPEDQSLITKHYTISLLHGLPRISDKSKFQIVQSILHSHYRQFLSEYMQGSHQFNIEYIDQTIEVRAYERQLRGLNIC